MAASEVDEARAGGRRAGIALTVKVRRGDADADGAVGGGRQRARGGDRAEARTVCGRLREHPVNALWARFTGVKDWDGHELRARFPRWADATKTSRGWATNHLMGLGWWCWIIPLKGGDTSIGLVYDTRLFRPPAGATIGERLRAHFQAHPVGREMLGEAQPLAGDERAFSALPYVSEQVAGDGWVLAGDAASFIDPLYSPGLDFCAFTASAARSAR